MVDINSKVSNLTKIILLSTSVDGLVESLELLKRFIQNKKNHLKKIEKITRSLQNRLSAEFRELTTRLSELGNEENSLKANMRLCSQEQSSLNHEKHDLEVESRTLAKEKESLDSLLVSLREKEQQLISTSGTSVSTLKEYDSKLKSLYESERTLTKEINGIERQSDSLSRDIKDLTENEDRIRKTLESFGYQTLLESFDVDQLLVELESEKKKLSGSLNTKAPETYVEISNGYRSMSTREKLHHKIHRRNRQGQASDIFRILRQSRQRHS